MMRIDQKSGWIARSIKIIPTIKKYGTNPS
jgi:hypothetical protein